MDAFAERESEGEERMLAFVVLRKEGVVVEGSPTLKVPGF